MNKQTGIWLDLKRAVIVYLQEDSHVFKIVESFVDNRPRVPGEGKWFTRMGNQFFGFDKKIKARQVKDIENYFVEIVNEIRGTEEVVLFGPAAMKNKLNKFIQKKQITGLKVTGVETADSMTDNQIAAWVKKYFKDQV